MKNIIIILSILLCQYSISQTTLYSDKNNVKLKINISKTNLNYECTNSEKKISIWKVEWIVENNSANKIRSNHSQIATGIIEVPMSPTESTNCHNRFINTNSKNLDNYPFIGFNQHTNYLIQPYEKIKTTWYYYSISEKKPVLTNWNMHSYKIIKEKKKEKVEDDFWNGKKENSKRTNNDQDDFWAGGKNKKGNKVENDFWKGKGTKNEEKVFEENTKAEESDKFIGNVRSRTNRIRIFCIDTGVEDGDLVSISNNGKILKSSIYLTNAGKSYWFDLKFGQNRIEIKALNQGSIGANTAAFKVFDDKGLELAQKGWHLKTGYKGTLLILKI